MITVEQFVKKYGDFIAVAGTSFEVPAGAVAALVGPNGAGKTTTIRTLCRILRPTSGSIHVAGCDLAKDPLGVILKSTIAAQGARGATVLVSSHLLSLVDDLCNYLVLIRHGSVLFHRPMEQARREFGGPNQSLEEIFFRLTSENA